MKTINEEIQKIKHLFNFKKGDRLLSEENTDGKDPNAGEIQKYLVDKGYLPRYRTENGVKKDNIDWDFGDTSAKAFGDFIKDKLGVDVGIQTLQDLQDYLDLLGFNTGSLGFGEKVYDAIKWVIDFTENELTNLVDNIETNKIIKQIVNTFILPKLNGISFTIKEDKLEKEDYYVKYEPKIESLTIQKFNSKNVWVKGSFSGPLHFKYRYFDLLEEESTFEPSEEMPPELEQLLSEQEQPIELPITEEKEERKQEIDPFEDVGRGFSIPNIKKLSIAKYIRLMKADERPMIQELLGRIPESYKYDRNKGGIERKKWFKRVNQELAKIQSGRGIRRKVK